MLIIALLFSFMLCALSVDVLFAVVGGTNCAESLSFGPQAISIDGSADKLHSYYLSTSTTPAHTEWTQVVTSDGTTELFRIKWTFTSSKTITERFSSAVEVGESVTFRVSEASTAEEHTYSGVWRFSSTAHISANTFSVTETSSPFSADSGAFGASAGLVDGHFSPPSSFWGVGNFEGDDDTQCSKIYRNGVPSNEYGANTKVYMYYSTPTTSANELPTFAPTKTPKVVGVHVQQQIDGISLSAYQASQSDCSNVYTLALQDALKSQGKGLIDNLIVTSVAPPVPVTSMQTYLRRPLGGSGGSVANSVLLDYTLTVQRSAGGGGGSVFYTQVSQVLQDSVATNQFTLLLQKYALQQGVPPLRTATSSIIVVQTVTVNDTSPDDNPKRALPFGLVIGFSAGVMVVILITCYTCVYGCANKTDIPHAEASAGEQLYTYCDCTELPSTSDSNRTTPVSDLDNIDHTTTFSNVSSDTEHVSTDIELTLVTARCVEHVQHSDPSIVPVAEVSTVRYIPVY